MDGHITRPLCIEGKYAVTVDGEGIYCAESGDLVGYLVGKVELTVDKLRAALTATGDTFGHWWQPLDGHTLATLRWEARNGNACDDYHKMQGVE